MWTGNANRSALVGDRPRNCLANPPGGVGAEFESPAVFELVHRPHQAGVPLLDQIQKAQAAIPVLLGDRNDQPQIAFGQFSFGLLIRRKDLSQHQHAAAQARRRLLQRHQDPAQLTLQSVVLVNRPFGLFQFVNLGG